MNVMSILGKSPAELFRKVRARAKRAFTRREPADPNDPRRSLYPTLQDHTGAPADDLDDARFWESSDELPERERSDFYNWGSE